MYDYVVTAYLPILPKMLHVLLLEGFFFICDCNPPFPPPQKKKWNINYQIPFKGLEVQSAVYRWNGFPKQKSKAALELMMEIS